MEILLETERLQLRRFEPSHVADVLALEEDPEVMRFLNGGRPPERDGFEERFLARLERWNAKLPLGVHALHERDGAFVGLTMLKSDSTFVEDIEVGWRLRRDRWGRGYATEAAQALVDLGFRTLGLPRLVSTSLVRNQKSQAVMRRLGFEPTIRFTYSSELLPFWGAQERLGQLCVLTRKAWAVRREQRHASGTARSIDHVQLALPPGGEPAARAFYGALLGLPERPKPAELAASGGLWFEVGPVRIHLGREADARPSKKAHVALVVDSLAALERRAAAAGHRLQRDERLPEVVRGYLHDPFGNRLELMEAQEGAA